MRRAFVTGANGQDGSYLTELLLLKGYEVHCLVRPAATFGTDRFAHIGMAEAAVREGLIVHRGDLGEVEPLRRLLAEVRPSEIYNLAAQSKVRLSFDEVELTGESSGLGAVRLMEAVRRAGLESRFYQASSSEMFGGAGRPQDEETAFRPRSPYAAAKAYAHWMIQNYREAYGLFAVNGILFNHESPRRGVDFVTRKISRAAAEIASGRADGLALGNLDATRDWGYAAEYVEGMWAMLQVDEPEDFVLATGVGYTVRQFLEAAFVRVGLDWREYVQFDERNLRPTEVDAVIGDASKAKELLGWVPSLDGLDLARLMVDADVHALENDGAAWVDTARLREWASR